MFMYAENDWVDIPLTPGVWRCVLNLIVTQNIFVFIMELHHFRTKCFVIEVMCLLLEQASMMQEVSPLSQPAKCFTQFILTQTTKLLHSRRCRPADFG
jgi:hypothetical protein